MDRYQKAGLALAALFMASYAAALNYASKEVPLPVVAKQEFDKSLTEEEKQNYGPDEVEQAYGVSLDSAGKKCSTYDPAKSDSIAKKKRDPEYTASLYYSIYGACPK